MNRTVTVRDISREAFEKAFGLIFLGLTDREKSGKLCIGYQVKDGELFLFQYSEKCTPLPYKFNLNQTIEFAWGWWQNNQNPTESEPDTDGSTKIAYEVSTERCGVGSFDWGTFVSVKPVWFVYGK